MKTNKMIVSAVAAVAVMSSWATDWYVDAVNGNDQWSGSTATVPTQEQIEAGGTVAGPRKTLHAMMSDEKVGVGDTVWAAEGDYNEGGTVYGDRKTVNRVQVKAGVKLVASGSRGATFITGSGGSYDNGAYSNGAVRCVRFLAPSTDAECGYGIVKGFTLKNGRTCKGADKNDNDAFAGGAWGNGLLVECDLVNNGCNYESRGGTIYKTTALRCHFISCNRGYIGYSSGVKVIDSLISGGVGFYYYCNAYNCTFEGSCFVRLSNTYNCFFVGTGASSSKQKNAGENPVKHYNAFSRSLFHETACEPDSKCRVVTAEETPYHSESFRPLVGSVAIDGGDLEKYAVATNGWTTAWLAECGKDYYGGERVVNGRIDVGCGEAQGSNITVEDSSTGLVTEGMNAGNLRVPDGSSIDVTFSRNFTSDKLCVGVKVNGEFYSFGGTTSDVPCTVTFPATPALDYSVVAVYEEDQKHWYVNPKGDDANPGYHIKFPRKTLDKAMELAKENAGHVVHAAAGTYDKFSEGYTASSRVTVKEGVGLVADEWPEKETIIVGASASEKADSNGNGPGAVRCVNVRSGAYVKGFKLTGGRTYAGDESSNAAKAGGGAYLNGGALIACEVTGNSCAYRGSGVYTENSSWIIGCNVHGNSGGSFQIVNGGVANSRVTGIYYGGGIVLNSRMGTVRSSGGARVFNSYLDSTSTASITSTGPFCTNCVFTSGVAASITDNSTYDPSTCVFSVSDADNLDDNFRPKNNVSPLVDAGSRELYDRYFSAKWVQFKDIDLKGGQRIYNAKIDVGCGEYDWRGDFASMLGTKAAITEMGENVTVDSASDIVVPEGDTIALSMPPRSSGRTTKYELTYTPDGGEATVVTEVSSEAFFYTLAGPCTVQSLTRSGSFTITIR
jgi:hypothetical protein